MPKDPEEEKTGAAAMVRVVNLFVRGSTLKNLDKGRDKSDTYCVLKMKWSAGQKDWLEVDQTEVVHDSLDPEWNHKFSVVLNFGQILHLRFEVLDHDNDGSSQLIGFYETTLSGLIKQKEVGQNAL